MKTFLRELRRGLVNLNGKRGIEALEQRAKIGFFPSAVGKGLKNG
jgi:hypothetical protein